MLNGRIGNQGDGIEERTFEFARRYFMTEKSDSNMVGSKANLSTSLVDLWFLLPKRRKVQLGLLLILTLLSAIAEMISLGAVLPFIGIMIDPNRVFNHPSLRGLIQMMGLTAPDQLVLPLVVGFASAALMAGAIRLSLLYFSTRLSFAVGADLGTEMYRRTLYQPYSIHLARNSSQVISGISSKSWDAVWSLHALLTLASSLVIIVALLATLMAIDPMTVLVATTLFGVSYGSVTWMFRRKLKANSEILARENINVIKALQEGLGGIREVLLNGAQQVYCETYRQADLPLRRAEGSNVFIVGSPRYVMESIGMVLIAALAYGLSKQPGGVAAALPILGALALGAQRLLPTVQQAYASWATLAARQSSLAEVIGLLKQELPPEASAPTPPPLQFIESICFKRVRFKYLTDGPWVVNELNLTIAKGARVGIVGTTGSGKSTALDLLMGLLAPTEGEILVDGRPVTGERLRSWQRTIAHVPQSIFLADSTLAENIAFGIPKAQIDLERVREAAMQAQLADFIESLREKYNAFVGERGMQLSGGQRQRVGIARALYNQASVLVFDEATSSLDNETEQAVMNAIESLERELTILIIAHRLSTVQRCDKILELAHGKVVAQGSYDQLLEQSPSFRRMALTVAR